MKITSIVLAALGILAFAGFASAQQPAVTPLPSAAASKMTEILASVSAESLTITTWYKQNVYDMANKKIGDISDVLVSPSDGKITVVVIGVGGFLGVGEKDVGVSFGSIKQGMMDGKATLTINTTKEALSAARGLKYDSKTSMWIVADIAAK